MSKNRPISTLEELAIACKQLPKHEDMQRWKRKSKSIFIRGIECQICHRVGSLQILGSYYRIRHYIQLINGKPQFEYHRNDKDYITKILSKTKPDQTNRNIHDLTNNHPDSKLNGNGSVNQNECKSEKVTQNFSRLGLC